MKPVKKIQNFIKNHFREVLVSSMFLVFFLIRFINLGYSEYTEDETAVLQYLKINQQFYSPDFLISQNKGPLQYVLAFLPFLISHNVYNEFLYRVPFLIANLAGLYFFFRFVKNMTGNFWVALFSSAIFGLNGFIVAFGRIVQYQSLNVLFSGLSLFYLSKLPVKENRGNLFMNTCLGALFFTLSLLTHWDAVFILPVIFYIFLITVKKKLIGLKTALLLLTAFAIVVVFVSASFLITYLKYVLENQDKKIYMGSRIGVSAFTLNSVINTFRLYFFRITLYNPFLFLLLILIFSGIGALFKKESRVFVTWFLFELVVFVFFFIKPGTHIYNLFMPLSVCFGYGAYFLYEKSKKYKQVYAGIISAFMLFLAYQNVLLFADVKTEYPWNTETVLFFKTPSYSYDYFTKRPWINSFNMIGFPIKRNWEEINMSIITENQTGNTVIPYLTNEDTDISGFYMDAKHDRGDEFYIINIRKPLSFMGDVSIPEDYEKTLVKTVKNGNKNLAKIYRLTKIR